nr:hypothetical protein [Tanacetum cinerariifolium]
MGGSSSQSCTDLALPPINAFLVEGLYTPEFLDSLQDNTGYWQAPNPHEYLVEQVATSATKKKKVTRNRQKRTIESGDAPHEVHEIRRPEGRDKAKADGMKNKGSKLAGSSNVNGDALARLMVTEMTAHEKEERLAFLAIKRRKVECREREIKQQDMTSHTIT